MTIASVVRGVVGKYLPKRRKAEKPDDLGEKYGHLPQDGKRRAFCKEAFEAGLEEIAKDPEFAAKLAVSPVLVWWRALGPLTKAERLATYMRVQEFAKVYLTRTADPAKSQE